MILIQNNQINELVLNVNRNSQASFSTYNLYFRHIMSGEIDEYVIDTSDPLQYGANSRFCEMIINLNAEPLPYEGQYELIILGDNAFNVFVGMVKVIDYFDFIQYKSDNEDNNNYIYIN